MRKYNLFSGVVNQNHIEHRLTYNLPPKESMIYEFATKVNVTTIPLELKGDKVLEELVLGHLNLAKKSMLLTRISTEVIVH